VLAAGGSARLGRPKQLLQFHGQSLVRRAVAAALGADCAPVAVVLGAEAERIKRELVDLEIVFVPNDDWCRGIGSSIRRGVAALRDCNAIAILACDQPHVDQNVLKNLIRTQPETQKPIVACAYSATLGIPALFVRDYFDRLLSLADKEGAKALIKAQPHDVASVDFPRGAIDIDTPADYRNLADES
jgi:molybdenum cofactor cytidylyltransferase